MAEILVKAISVNHSNPDTDRRGCYKRGMPVVIMPDNHPWGLEERRPKFVVIKIPTISVSTISKYIQEHIEGIDIYRRRIWIIRVDDMPAAARNKLANTGQLIIKAGSYSDTYDYTWGQVKSYFRDQKNNVDEMMDI